VQAATVRVTHASPGRTRWKVSEIKRDAGRARDLEEQLRTLPGVHSVDASPVTGSLLVKYHEPAVGSLEPHYSVAKVLGISLNDLVPDELRLLMSHRSHGATLSDDLLVSSLEAAMKQINAEVKKATGADLGILLPVMLAVLGIRSLFVSEKSVTPSWHEYLWFAFSSYFLLDRARSFPRT